MNAARCLVGLKLDVWILGTLGQKGCVVDGGRLKILLGHA